MSGILSVDSIVILTTLLPRSFEVIIKSSMLKNDECFDHIRDNDLNII